MKPEITRFAPSPTGHLHLGGARTAFFSWLFAKSSNGKFLLRFEDTDQERSKKEFEDSIILSLSWLGIKPDEDPFFQSKNIEIHKKTAFNLLEAGKAYSCDCSSEQLAEMREKQIKNKLQPKYDGTNRENNLVHKKGNVIRFKMPQSGKTAFEDKILGNISVENKELDDFIILRADETPTYNFCAAFDDMHMKITTVIRGDDHITNTLKQINILNSLDAELPNYGHLPMVLSNSGKRLSKRDGAIDILDYKKNGYLKESIINYLAKLGWSHSDKEIFSIDELLDLFSLEAVNSSPAKFSDELLNYYNNYYLKKINLDDLISMIENNFLDDEKFKMLLKKREIIELERESSNNILEMTESLNFYYQKPFISDDLKANISIDIKYLNNFIREIEQIKFEKEEIENFIKSFLQRENLKFPELGKPLRIILTGKTNAPSITELFYLIGKEECLERMKDFIS